MMPGTTHSTPPRLRWGAPLLVSLALSACGTRGTLYTSALTPLPIVATSSALVQVVPQTQRAVVIRPGQPTPKAVRISEGAMLAVRAPTTERVVILGGLERTPKVDLLDLTNDTVRTVDAPRRFDTVSFSADGRFALLASTPTRTTSTLVARNASECALLDTEAGVVTRVDLDTESEALRGASFGPLEAQRQLVAVILEAGVAVFDALHPEVPARRIAVRPPGSTLAISVQQAIFSANAHWLFVRAGGIDDIIVIELGPEVGSPPAASINFITGGRGLADLASPPAGYDDAVLAVFTTSLEATLLDARGIQDATRRLPLPAPLTRLASLTGNRVLVWGDNARTVVAWDVADGRTGVTSTAGFYSGARVLQARDMALLPNISNSGAALSTVTVIEEANRLRLGLRVVQLARPLAYAAADDTNTRLFFNVTSSPAVVTLDVASQALTEVALDTPATRLTYLSSGDFVVAEHASTFGDMTLVPAGTEDRTSATRISDFAFTEDLQRPEDRR